eukprot:scaffold46043_cov252-Amphora_coffeaeformis.AAC.1
MITIFVLRMSCWSRIWAWPPCGFKPGNVNYRLSTRNCVMRGLPASAAVQEKSPTGDSGVHYHDGTYFDQCIQDILQSHWIAHGSVRRQRLGHGSRRPR